MVNHLIKLYFSPTENTKKIVDTVGNELNPKSTVYDITLPNKRQVPYSFSFNDILVAGVPSYGGRVPYFITDNLRRLDGNGAIAILIVTYGNRQYEDTLIELRDIFISSGFRVIAAGAFIGEHSMTKSIATNRPNDEDKTLARGFANRILKRLAILDDIDLKTPLLVPGNSNYVEKKSNATPMAPSTNNSCTHCGLCADHCPIGAIDFDNYSIVDQSKCIRCHSCVKRCKTHSKSFSHPIFLEAQQSMIKAFGSPDKSPEFYLK